MTTAFGMGCTPSLWCQPSLPTCEKEQQEALEKKMLGPFATVSRHTLPVLHCHSPGVANVARRHCCTPPVHQCPQHQQQQRQRVTEGTTMAPWNGPNKWQ